MNEKIRFLLIFFIGTAVGLFLWSSIELPFSNPLQVTSFVTELQFNPASNIVRFLVLLLFPSLLLFFILKAAPKIIETGSTSISLKTKDLNQSSYSPFLFVVVFALLSLLVPTFLSWGAYDWFHEGDALTAAEGVRHGMIPYRDLWFVHGLYQDVYRVLLSYEFFGFGVDAARTLESIHKVIAYSLLAFLLIRIFDGEKVKYWAAGAILLALHGASFGLPPVAIIPRELLALVFFIILLGKDSKLKWFIIGFVPWLGIIYALDRGVYLIALLAIITLINLIQKKVPAILSSLAGSVVGVLVLYLVLGEGFKPFIQAVIEMPEYHDLIMGKPYPIYEPQFLLACLLLSGAAFWLFSRAFVGKQFKLSNILENHKTELLLFCAAVIWFRNTLNRPDKFHLEYGTLFSYLFWIYVIFRYYSATFLRKEVYVLAAASLWLVAGVSILNLLSGRGIAANFPVFSSQKPDLLADYSASEQIKELVGDEDFFTMSFDSTWHHALQSPPVSGYSMTWFAATSEMQKDLINRLRTKNITWVIRDTRDKRALLDNLTIDKRLPLISKYLNENYSAVLDLGDIKLLKRDA